MASRVVKNKRNQYVAYCDDINGKRQFAFNINRYGEERAKLLAEMSMKSGIKIHDYYKVDNDVVTFYVVTKRYGEIEVLFDTEDFKKIIPYKLNLSNDKNAKTFYCKVANGIGIHRIIMDAPEGTVVDHINRNGLDNRKSNLRVVNTSINNRNANLRPDNSSGLKGVTFERGKRYKAEWYDNEMVKHSKSFSINKYGGNALQMAMDYRLSMEKKYGYISAYERSETNETVSNTVEMTEQRGSRE